MRLIRAMMIVITSTALLLLKSTSPFAGDDSNRKGVFEYVIKGSELSFAEAANRLDAGIDTSEFTLLARLNPETPEDCPYQAAVYVVYDSMYGGQLIAANHLTGPFAVTDRISLFTDESGTHVSIVNPCSINRTVLLDDHQYADLSEEHRLALRSMIVNAISETESDKQYGKIRKKGYIGRTFGVMAGGPFDQKLKQAIALPEAGFTETLQKLEAGMRENAGKWGMHHVYTVVFPEEKTAILGSTGAAMESKSFSIVKAGSDKSRKDFECPGIAHAGAYPIEIVMVQDDSGTITVYLPHIMYRMKMYFEDAGKWAFAKNMGMPGSIEDELRQQIESALGQ